MLRLHLSKTDLGHVLGGGVRLSFLKCLPVSTDKTAFDPAWSNAAIDDGRRTRPRNGERHRPALKTCNSSRTCGNRIVNVKVGIITPFTTASVRELRECLKCSDYQRVHNNSGIICGTFPCPLSLPHRLITHRCSWRTLS